MLIFFFNFSSKLQGLPCAENIGLLQYFFVQYVAALSSMTLFHHPRYLSRSFLKIPSYSINTDQHLLPAFWVSIHNSITRNIQICTRIFINLLSDIAMISGVVLTVLRISCSKDLFFPKLRILQWNIENPFCLQASSNILPDFLTE